VLSHDRLREAATGDDPRVVCQRLIDAANALGTPDNLTAAVVRVTSPPPASARPGWRALVTRVLGGSS
jgi:serine/threonine protein phosphatase PrpC